MKALVLAGGFPQIELINQLKSRGIYTVLADWNTDPVAQKYADKYYQISTLDIEAVTKAAQYEQVDFIITVCTDQALLTVARVSEDLGLPCYIDYHTALNVTNKQFMKEMFFKYGIPTALSCILEDFDLQALENFSYPLIVKPVDCNSSKGVAKVNDEVELREAFMVAKEYSRTNTVVVEEFVDGKELSIDVYVDHGVAHVLDITTSVKIQDQSKFIINRTWHPAKISDKVRAKISKVAQNIANAFNISNAPMLIQMIESNDDINVLEFSARTGGGVKDLTIRERTGFDVIKAVIDLTLGQDVEFAISQPTYPFMVDEYIYCKSGKFSHLSMFEELKQRAILEDYYLFKWVGAEFDSISSSGDRIAGFSIVGNDMEEIISKHELANSQLKVIDCNGNDMMRHDLLLSFHEGNR